MFAGNFTALADRRGLGLRPPLATPPPPPDDILPVFLGTVLLVLFGLVIRRASSITRRWFEHGPRGASGGKWRCCRAAPRCWSRR